MKKIITLLLLVITILCFSACSDKDTNNTDIKNTTEVIVTFPNRTTTEKQVLEDSVYEKVYFEMFGNKVNAAISQE